MTCQWCVHYRRRRGVSVCCSGSELVPAKTRADGCDDFLPRKSCTTCAARCTPEARADLVDATGVCRSWRLRELSTWGGARRRKKSISVKQNMQERIKQ